MEAYLLEDLIWEFSFSSPSSFFCFLAQLRKQRDGKQKERKYDDDDDRFYMNRIVENEKEEARDEQWMQETKQKQQNISKNWGWVFYYLNTRKLIFDSTRLYN